LIPGNQFNAGRLQPWEKSLDDAWAGGYLLYVTILRSGQIQHFHPAFHPSGYFPGEVTGPGGWMFHFFWAALEFSSNKSDPLHEIA